MVGPSPGRGFPNDLRRSPTGLRRRRCELELLTKVGDSFIRFDDQLIKQDRSRLKGRLQFAAAFGQTDLHRGQFVSLRLSLPRHRGLIDDDRGRLRLRSQQ